jgi:hypothetical protein
MRASMIICAIILSGWLTGCSERTSEQKKRTSTECKERHPAVTGTWVLRPGSTSKSNPIAFVAFVHDGSFIASGDFQGVHRAYFGRYTYSGGTAGSGRLRLVFRGSDTQTREYDVEIRGDDMIVGETKTVLIRLK